MTGMAPLVVRIGWGAVGESHGGVGDVRLLLGWDQP